MTSKPAPFIWYDIMTPDVKAAEAFYAKVVGWKIADSGMPGMSYSILNAGDTMVGGMMSTVPGGPPPMWTGYIYSADVDADTKLAVKLGGSICKEPEDIPGVGRFSVINDPAGAMFNLFKPGSDQSPAKPAEGTPGHIGWRELHSDDWKKAWPFYEKMFGWSKLEAMDMGEMGTYQIYKIDDGPAGGMMTRDKNLPHATWLYYFNVEAVDAALARLKEAGGKLCTGPMEVPGGQWILHATDPQGALFALVAPKR